MLTGSWRWFWAGVVVAVASLAAGAQPSAISYQGALRDGGVPAEGAYDLRFRLYAAASGGTELGEVERPGVQVADGVFSVELDFGVQVFVDGAERWVEVAARAAGAGGGWTVLSPRSRLTATPYAVRAAVAGEAAWAADGPFAPADETPRSTSGLVDGATVTASLTRGGSSGAVGVSYPIVMERIVVQGGGGGPSPAQMSVARVSVFRGRSGSAWFDAFAAASAGFDLSVKVSAGGSVTEYRLEDATAVGYRIEIGSDGGPVEVLDLVTQAALVSRERSGAAPAGSEPPRPGGATPGPSGSPGTLAYGWGGAVPALSAAGVLPNEARDFHAVSGAPTGGIHGGRVAIAMNAMGGSVLWDAFTIGQTRPLDLRLLPGGGVVWGLGSQGVLVRWELRLADDGGVFEHYEAEYYRPGMGP